MNKTITVDELVEEIMKLAKDNLYVITPAYDDIEGFENLKAELTKYLNSLLVPNEQPVN